MSEKLFTQFLLVLTLCLSLAIFLAALNVIGPGKVEAWAVLVAVLAVISSIISAWSSYSVVDLQREALKPHVTVSYDFESRFGLALLRMKNTGGTPAINIQINWNNKLKNHKEKEVDFTSPNSNSEVVYLANGEAIYKIIDSDFRFFERYTDTTISGNISYQDLKGNDLKTSFQVSAEHLRGSPNYSNEELKTNYEIQKIPKSLDNLTSQIKNLSNQLKK